MKYTYSDEDDEGSDALSARRSRQQSGISTPAEPSGPTFTASGRQVRSSRQMLSGQQVITERPNLRGLDGAHDDELRPESRGRPRRIAQQNGVESVPRSRRYTKGYNSLDSMDEESDATSSGREWADGDDEELDDRMDDEDEEVETSDNEVFEGEGASVQQSLMVSLRYKKSSLSHPSQNVPKGRLISEDRSDLPDILTDTTHMPGVEPLDKPVPSHYTEAKQSQPSGNSSSESALHASKVQNGDGFSPKNEANTSSAPSESKLVAGVPIGNHL